MLRAAQGWHNATAPPQARQIQTGSAGGYQKPGARPTNRYQDSPNGVSRFGGQAGTQATDPTLPAHQTAEGRAGSTTHILPAESALLRADPVARVAARILSGRVGYGEGG